MIKILDRFFSFVRSTLMKSNLLYMVRNCWLYKKFIKDIWHNIHGLNEYYNSRSCHKPNSFYTENAERVYRISNMLADEKSKKTYLGMVKFRQTCEIKDFPVSLCEKEQYFIEELKLDDNEVFVDCGAYDGDTINTFLKHCRSYKEIIAFEPNDKVFEILKRKHGNNPKITLIKAGVFDKDGEVSFNGCSHGASKIIESSPIASDNLAVIKVRTIDGLNLQNVSFIKMDIEGTEFNALKGSEKTILKDKPKLAISIYHSDDDMIRIAEYIHDLLPEHKLYVRQHYKYSITETVLYAFP